MIGQLRRRLSAEAGFTLVELLVVMLILGILMTLAITAFLNQRSKANDANAKTVVRTMETAEEACSTDNRGDYSNCDETALVAIEPSIQTGQSVTAITISDLSASGYTVTATSATKDGSGSNVDFTIQKSGGSITRSCSAPGVGACQKKAGGGTTGTW